MICLSLAAAVLASLRQVPAPEAPKLHAIAVTGSPVAQADFDAGFDNLCGFHDAAAVQFFRKAIADDPTCAMAYWGIAAANGPNLNVPTDDSRCADAIAALRKAHKLLDRITPLERDLIQAQEKRFGVEPQGSRTELDLAYANSMRKLWKSYPNDAEVGALFAEAMLDLRPWDQWKPDGTPEDGTTEAVSTLHRVLEIDPKNLLGLHMTIHAWEASLHPEQALPAADTLRGLHTKLGHLAHMPSHIYVRVGHWLESIGANEDAIANDAKQNAGTSTTGVYRLYMIHNRHMLAYSAAMAGQSAKAIKAADAIRRDFDTDYLRENASTYDWFLSMSFEMRMRFGMWNEILQMPSFGADFPVSNAMRRATRGIAYAALHQLDKARSEQKAFGATFKDLPPGAEFDGQSVERIMSIEWNLLDGEILLAAGRLGDAEIDLRKAVKLEDSIAYSEPPVWTVPVRHVLGAVLIKAKRFPAAINVYQADLKRHPNNGWALYGLWKAYQGGGQTANAAEAEKLFKAAWQTADHAIDSSCLCAPLK